MKNGPLEVRDTGTAKGRGVFALRDFAAGEVVEEVPVVLGRLSGSAGDFEAYDFNWSSVTGAPQGRPYQPVIALGFGCLYNHSDGANLRYEGDDATRRMRFIARREIAAGEELLVNYVAPSGESSFPGSMWFRDRGIDYVP